jgi:uncharacterized protein (UPF0335 family)
MRGSISAAAPPARRGGAKNSGDERPAALDGKGERSHACAPHRKRKHRARVMKSDVVNAGHLRSFIERVEKLEEEKKALSDDIKDVYAEAKGNGFDVKILRKIVSMRRQDREKRREEQEILDLYLAALGME